MHVVTIGAPGSIYKIKDKIQLTTDENSYHRYLIIGSHEENPQSFYQAVAITSMCNKEVTYEIPIMLDGMISYIVPYNIHSLSRADLNRGLYRGSIIGNEEYTFDDFIALIHALHYSLICDHSLLKDTEKKYNEYCNFFFSTHQDMVEYRTTKPDYEKNAEGCSLHVVKPTNEKRNKNASKISKNKSHKKTRRSRATIKEPEGFQELLKEYNSWRISVAAMAEELGMDAGDLRYLLKGKVTRKGKFFSKENPYADLYRKGYTRITDDVLKKEGYSTKSKIPMSYHDVNLLNTLTKETPQNVTMWDLSQKVQFKELFEMYGGKILSNYQKRWTENRINEIYNSCKSCYIIKKMEGKTPSKSM